MGVTWTAHRSLSRLTFARPATLCAVEHETLTFYWMGMAMKAGRFTLSAMALMGAVVLANCGDSNPAAPVMQSDARVEAGLLGTATNGLLACSPLASATTSKIIGTGGGTITVGPHTLAIPAGSLSGNVTIKAVLKSESANRVHFEPEGLQFAKGATLTMSYANCGLLSSLAVRQIAYVKPDLSLLNLLLSVDNLLTRKVSAQIQHFSDYAVEEFSLSDHAVYWGGGAERK